MKNLQSEDAATIQAVDDTAGEKIEELYSFHNNFRFLQSLRYIYPLSGYRKMTIFKVFGQLCK